MDLKDLTFYISLLAILMCVFIWSTFIIKKRGDNIKDYEIICLGGHEYYNSSFLAKEALAIRVDDNGKPIQCK